jgi:hypothetical protein
VMHSGSARRSPAAVDRGHAPLHEGE